MRIFIIILISLSLQLLFINGEILSEYKALMGIRSAITLDPQNSLSSWNSTTHHCTWYGIICSSTPPHSVISLNISSLHLTGTLSPDIGFLINLQTLSVSENFFNGSLPSSLSSLKALRVLDLWDNSFTGPLPFADVVEMPGLRHLDLGDNHFSGEIPESFSQLKNLTYLSLEINSLHGAIPEFIGDLPELVELYLEQNNFSGRIPQKLGTNGKLRLVYLQWNNLTGNLPESLVSCQSLTYIFMDKNWLNGSIPKGLFSLPNLTVLCLGDNLFTGGFPETHDSVALNLELILLSYNKLSGSLPPSIANFSCLQSLALGGNGFTGSIPPEIGNLQQLRGIHLENNNFTGSIPPEIGNLQQLGGIDLSSNNFTGSIPPEIGNLQQLGWIDLSSNNFSGKISPQISNCKMLTYVNLSSNQLTGDVPEIRTGPLENFLWPNGSVVDISYNMLQGALPVFSPNLSVFFASNNRLSGPIDLSICNLADLTDLDLSNNYLTGQIPSCLGSSSIYLTVLNLQRNNFSGRMFVNFSWCDNLMYLDFSYNRLEVAVPRSLAQCNNLKVLDLGNNMLNDTFPDWLGTLSNLQVLALRSNYFHGTVTSSYSKQLFSKLRILDLSENQFNGALLSKFIENMRAMKNTGKGEDKSIQYLGDHRNSSIVNYDFSVTITFKKNVLNLTRILNTLTSFDVSRNKFQGDVPISIGDLDALRLLNLSHNNFSNHIPRSIGNLRVLESLDLSCNNLSGEIPQEIETWTALAVFNVSQNQLFGPIPYSTQLSTFNYDSYLGNPGLCGPPLSKKCTNGEAPQQLLPTSVNPPDTKWSLDINLGEVILMGCAFGWVIGVTLGYFILSAREPLWLSRLAYQVEYRLIQRLKIRAREHQRRATRV